ncbi:MAG: hypothetical protein F6K48_01225 [Okeania sp. SIO3H1]|uniref:hypothetical protein n=1 Tax=Okeania sp. SIO1I7 TaxID=2607772 RepID=UPI0013CB3F49|nr:hypothetical protein [Okeania sp. SIO1I7]NEN87615.1 hypothetical protein [Okeania sp. SIO3H1]NET24882.1 hypothetical protein [Okeania sp. SIO1I7]
MTKKRIYNLKTAIEAIYSDSRSLSPNFEQKAHSFVANIYQIDISGTKEGVRRQETGDRILEENHSCCD